MPNLAPARTRNAPCFADRKIWEVIVQDKLFLVLASRIGIELLRVFARAKRCQAHRLRLAAAEQRRTMRARQYPNLALDRPDLVETASVQALVLAHDQTAHGFLLHVIKSILKYEVRHFLRAEFFH